MKKYFKEGCRLYNRIEFYDIKKGRKESKNNVTSYQRTVL
jgi:hypothetical protein